MNATHGFLSAKPILFQWRRFSMSSIHRVFTENAAVPALLDITGNSMPSLYGFNRPCMAMVPE